MNRAITLLGLCTLLGCSDDGAAGTGDLAPQCEVGATKCEGGQIASCVEQGGTRTWGPLADCPTAGELCRDTACAAPTAKQLGQAMAVEQYAADLRDYTGYPMAIDFVTLVDAARRIVFLGDETTYSLAKAIQHVFNAVPQGHATIGFGPADFSTCTNRDSRVPLRGTSWYSVCGRAAGDAAIVTYALPGNTLGLTPGDRVTSLTRGQETWTTPGFLARIHEEPSCDSAVPNPTARADWAASNLFAILQAGDRLSVTAPDGTVRTVTAPARDPSTTSCFDPLHRAERTTLFATAQRPDGVVVVILPTLGNHADHPLPNPFTLDSYRTWVAESIDGLNAALAKYTNVTGLVWDIRGNSGGSQELGIALMKGALLGPTVGALANCNARIPGSSPPAFATAVEYPMPYQVFIDKPVPQIAFSGKQVLLTDGFAVSAADWMALAAHRAGVKIVGHASMGAYGYTTGGSYVTKHIAPVDGVHFGILSYISGARCRDTTTGADLEGDAPVDTPIDFAPGDLAKGIDTQLEEAARQARTP